MYLGASHGHVGRGPRKELNGRPRTERKKEQTQSLLALEELGQRQHVPAARRGWAAASQEGFAGQSLHRETAGP